MLYDVLQIKVKSFIYNTSDDVISMIPDFIKWGQNELEKKLRIRGMKYTVPNNPYLAKDSRRIAIPSDYLEVNYLLFTDQLHPPILSAFTKESGGSLAAGTYYYRVSSINALGESLACEEASTTATLNQKININWTKVTGATGYKIYGRTTGAEKLIATVGDVATYTDSGSVTPSGALPDDNTTGTVRYSPLERYNERKHKFNISSILKTSTGLPVILSDSDGYFIFNIYADKDYVYELNYYRKQPALSDSVQTNWWTDNAEEALLFASLFKAIPFLGNDPRSGVWIEGFKNELENLRSQNKKEQISGQSQSNDLNFGRNVFF